MLDVRTLFTLVEVVNRGSFAAAGRELGYTASAVSHQISVLEQSIGIALFERGSRSITPTGAAVVLAQRAGTVISHWIALEAEVTALANGTQGVLRIGTFPTAGRWILPAALAHMRENGSLRVMLDEGEAKELVDRVETNSLDAAVVYEYGLAPVRWPRFLQVRRLLYRERLLVLAGSQHPLAERPRIRFAELESDPWIATNAGSAGAINLSQLCHGAEVSPSITLRTNDYSVMQGLVSSGAGVAIVPELAVLPDFDGCTWTVDIPGAWRESFMIARAASAPVRILESALLAAGQEIHFAGHRMDRIVS